MDTSDNLSERQLEFIQDFQKKGGENAIGKKFEMIRQKDKIVSKWNNLEFAILEVDLFQLATKGFVTIHLTSSTLQFNEKMLQVLFQEKSVSNLKKKPKSFGSIIIQVDIVQVYTWLVACIIAALFSLFLLGITVQQAVAGNITTSVLSVIMTVVSSMLSRIFFSNYDKANERLKHLRDKLSTRRK